MSLNSPTACSDPELLALPSHSIPSMDDEGPTITILLLGNSECGKSTFLRQANPLLSPSQCALPNAIDARSRLTQGRDGIANPSIPLKPLRDTDQPFPFSIRMYNRPYRFEFYDTASPHQHYSLLQPDFVILCFDINDRRSLEDVKNDWRKQVYLHYYRGEGKIPVMLLGLKRDLRDKAVAKGTEMVDPMEAYRFAQEMRCDRYAECSALTGELMHEVFEDIAKVAALTTTEKGGLSEGSTCGVM